MQHTTEYQGELWEVFLQGSNGQPFKHAGSLHAFDRDLAIQNARDLFTRRNEAVAMWVVPASAIVSVPADETQAFFEPAQDKDFRHPTFYEVPDGVKNM